MSHSGPTSIPGTLNITIAAAAVAAALILLRAASLGESWLLTAAAALAFSFIGNTVFACLHECVHGVFHRSKTINDLFGIVCAAMFPTGYSLQRSAHLGHHERNRSESERFDYYAPEDSRALKTLQWYGIISGIYWIVVVAGWLVYLVCPFLFSERLWRNRHSARAEHTSGPAYARSFSTAPPVRSRIELLFTLVCQAALFWLLDLSVTGWLACYLAFGLNWSALQYADHAFSPLHVTEGAWDLRVHPLVQAIFLNYHLHLAHHRRPGLSWIHLPKQVDSTRPRPSFLRHYLRMWAGPQPLHLATSDAAADAGPGPTGNAECTLERAD